MEWGVIGLSVGVVLALTGAGGAVLAIPLFMTLLNMSLLMATTSSLVVVFLAASIGAISQDGKINFRIVILLSFSSILGAWLALPLKFIIPELVLKLLLAILSLYSLMVMWRPINWRLSLQNRAWVHLPGGLVLGALTTLTGLGGGVILLPWLKLTTGRVDIVTSLMTIALVSSFSLALQVLKGALFPSFQDIVMVSLSIIAATFLIKKLVSLLSTDHLHKVHLYTFSLVVAFTLTTLFGT